MKKHYNHPPFIPAFLRVAVLPVLSLITALTGSTSSALAADLGTAMDFAVLGASEITNTGPTTLNGDLGIWAGTSITGLAGITVNGEVHQTDAVAEQAQSDLTAAYNQLAGLAFDTDLSGQDLGTVGPLLPGVYRFSSSAQLTGALVLDAEGVQASQFIFQIGSALTTASSSTVLLLNNASGNNVFWLLGSSATLGTNSLFQGNLLALTSITLNTGTEIGCGRALARNGAVTLDSNTITADCSDDDGGGTGNGNLIPEPGSFLLVGIGLAMCSVLKMRSAKK